MKKLFLILLLVALPVFGAVTSSTLTTVVANTTYYVSTEFGPGVQARHISLFIDYTVGDEHYVSMTIEWKPDETWAGTSYYAIGERTWWWNVEPVVFYFYATDRTYFRVLVPDGMSRMYVTIAYDDGTLAGYGAFILNARRERN
jgi:hypothetical protein